MEQYQFSQGITWFEGQWLPGDTPIMSGMSSGGWIASTVFDGLRAFDNVMPDGDLHCQRLLRSSQALGHQPDYTWQQVFDLCWEGITRFPTGEALYIRPMIWADSGFIAPDAGSEKLAVTLFPMPMPQRNAAMTAMITDFARPLPQTAPTKAKAAALYPNSGLAIKQARENGFHNAVIQDVFGNIAEFSASNLFVVKDGRVITPVDNGSFLCGLTRQRTMALLAELHIPCVEGCVTKQMLLDADEVISTGNYAKIMTVSQIDQAHYPRGPVFEALYDAYHRFAAGQRYSGRKIA